MDYEKVVIKKIGNGSRMVILPLSLCKFFDHNIGDTYKLSMNKKNIILEKK